MNHRTAIAPIALAALLVSQSSWGAPAMKMAASRPVESQAQVARSVAAMVSNVHARRLVRRKGLRILNVMWEDTGRYQGSSVGPNISDVTIEVEVEDARGIKRRHLMPVIRYPNFSDKTGDVDIDKFFVPVGNQRKGGAMQTISLRQLLAHPTRYMSLPSKGRIKGGTLLAKRDKKVLTSAQSAFLPIRSGGKTRFWPVIFNYQSYAKNPAVLTILVTRQGTSMTIIDNKRDTVGGGGSWGQRLYFNAAGKRAPLTAERLADVKARGTTMNGDKASSLGKDANLMMIIQVPLKVKRRPMRVYDMEMAGGVVGTTGTARPSTRRGRSDVDVAVLGHGKAVGPYTELDGLTIERDSRFPVRVTVQFYQATSNGVIDKANVSAFAAQIRKVYRKADYVGSLVVPDPNARKRSTQWTGVTRAPANLTWADFPGLVERYRTYGMNGINWYQRMFTWR